MSGGTAEADVIDSKAYEHRTTAKATLMHCIARNNREI